jgi:hypothetical protein
MTSGPRKVDRIGAAALALCALAGCVRYPDVPPRRPAPVPRQESIDVTSTIEGVTITATPEGNVGWEIAVSNDGDEPALIVWDESAFVAASGRSWGRLIPTTTRRMDIDAPHPATPVPAHSEASATVIPREAVAEYEHGMEVRKAIDGGRIVVAIRRGSGTANWEGVVRELAEPGPQRAPRGWCFDSEGDGLVCERTKQDCIAKMRTINPERGLCEFLD